jgi:hypothetical protein
MNVIMPRPISIFAQNKDYVKDLCEYLATEFLCPRTEEREAPWRDKGR